MSTGEEKETQRGGEVRTWKSRDILLEYESTQTWTVQEMKIVTRDFL